MPTYTRKRVSVCALLNEYKPHLKYQHENTRLTAGSGSVYNRAHEIAE